MSRRVERIGLGAILLLFAVLSMMGITWGLPSRSIDSFLFGDDKPWSGEKIYRLAGAEAKFLPDRGADVDADPLHKTGAEPILLTKTEADVARIYLRYRLYTYQPDEMITMMALAGMNPRELRLDPRLYQYGGLFIYPVGGLIAAAGGLGLIDVRSDVVYYLDHPDEFGKFYVVARAYAAIWGLIGVFVVFAIAKRLGDARAGLLAALIFALMPVVVCMAHEGKPHLPGAVLMLLAVLAAMRHVADGKRRDWWLMCAACGAAVGMVLSSAPICVLIPIVAWYAARGGGRRPVLRPLLVRMLGGFGIAAAVYLLTNPYIAINAVINREVLRSNFGNSLAMYQIARVGEGFVRVLELTVEGATLPVFALGTLALAMAVARRKSMAIPLAVPAVVLFVQFVLIGAGKPAEYGRFGVFTNTALAIGTACLLARKWTRRRELVNWIPAAMVVAWVAIFAELYQRNFSIDATPDNSRTRVLRFMRSAARGDSARAGCVRFVVKSEPAPYCCPPLNFARNDVLLAAKPAEVMRHPPSGLVVAVYPVDHLERQRSGLPTMTDRYVVWTSALERFNRWGVRTGIPETPISWANKPFVILPATPGGL
ncbi:MAG: glycosyltransferase family 39 protein, partial [Phycisphaerae bacterium]